MAIDQEMVIHRVPYQGCVCQVADDACACSILSAAPFFCAGSDVVVAHVGDSRAILCTVNSSGPHTLTDPESPAVTPSGEDGDSSSAAVLLTEDHQPGLEGERRRILSSGGTVEGGNGALTALATGQATCSHPSFITVLNHWHQPPQSCKG